MPIRVMQVVAAPARASSIGANGPERRSANLIAKWEDVGITPIVLYPRRGRLWSIFAGAKVTLFDFEIRSKVDAPSIIALYRIIRSERVDVVHTQGPASLDLLAGISATLAGRPFIITRPIPDQFDAMPGAKKFVYTLFDKIAVRLASKIVAVCEQGRKDMIVRYASCAEKVSTIHNGVNIARFARTEDRPLHLSACRCIGMTAQLKANKGWFDFISIVRKLVDSGVFINALIIGDGPIRAAVESAVREQGLEEHIFLCGQVDDVAAVLATLDLFLFTSYREGLPMAVLEAMASGLPIIASDVAGIGELVEDGVNGYLVRPGDVDHFVAACIRLLQETDLIKTMGMASARIVADKFTENRMLGAYATLYQRVANERAPSFADHRKQC